MKTQNKIPAIISLFCLVFVLINNSKAQTAYEKFATPQEKFETNKTSNPLLPNVFNPTIRTTGNGQSTSSVSATDGTDSGNDIINYSTLSDNTKLFLTGTSDGIDFPTTWPGTPTYMQWNNINNTQDAVIVGFDITYWPVSTKISEVISNNDFIIYPSPSQGKLIINIDKKNDKKVNIRIYNITGKLICLEEINNINETNIPIDISQYADGIYLLQVVIDNKIVSKKIVKH